MRPHEFFFMCAGICFYLAIVITLGLMSYEMLTDGIMAGYILGTLIGGTDLALVLGTIAFLCEKTDKLEQCDDGGSDGKAEE